MEKMVLNFHLGRTHKIPFPLLTIIFSQLLHAATSLLFRLVRGVSSPRRAASAATTATPQKGTNTTEPATLGILHFVRIRMPARAPARSAGSFLSTTDSIQQSIFHKHIACSSFLRSRCKTKGIEKQSVSLLMLPGRTIQRWPVFDKNVFSSPILHVLLSGEPESITRNRLFCYTEAPSASGACSAHPLGWFQSRASPSENEAKHNFFTRRRLSAKSRSTLMPSSAPL